MGGFEQMVFHMSRRGVLGHLRSFAARVAHRMYRRRSRGSMEETISREGRLTFFCAPRATRRQAFWHLSRRERTARGAVERTREPYSRMGLIHEV